MKVEVGLRGRDRLEMEYEITNGNIVVSSFSVMGCLPFLKAAKAMKESMTGPIAQIVVPSGKDHVSLLLQEVLRKVRGEWQFPYNELLLCKCRSIATTIVDEAIVAGAHDHVRVGICTSAGTSCGTCKKDIETLLQYRLKFVP